MTVELQSAAGLEREQAAHDAVIVLGSTAVYFATIERALHYLDGGPENDAEHSFHLALTATELAGTYFPELDSGLVTQFSVVHDLPERYAGDVRTFAITPEELERKIQAEREATERLMGELPPYTSDLLRRYEEQKLPEARFVRFVDKILPNVINIVAGEGRATMSQEYGVNTLEELRACRTNQLERLQAMFPDFPFLHAVEALIAETTEKTLFPEGNSQIIDVITEAMKTEATETMPSSAAVAFSR